MGTRAVSKYQLLSLAAASGTFGLIVVGGIVRVTGSGLGCPDWPTCHGQLIPPLEPAALIEYTHRLLGALVSPLILLTAAGAWILHRRRAVLLPALAAPVLLAVQIVLGAVVVWLELPGMVVLVHLGFAMLILGAIVWVTVLAGDPSLVPSVAVRPLPLGEATRVQRLAWATCAASFALILTGAYVRARGASWACAGFPSCNGALLPFGVNSLVDLHLLHRLLAFGVAALIGWTAIQVWRAQPSIPGMRPIATALVLLAAAQLTIGAVAVSTGVPPLLQGLHLAGAAAVWTCAVALAGVAWRIGPTVAQPAQTVHTAPSHDVRSVLQAYLGLTKPRVMSLLLATTLAAMMIAAGGFPALSLVWWTLLGGALAAGGASAINCYLDRDIDRLMGRTALRAIPAGRVKPGHALMFGVVLGLLSCVVLVAFVNVLAALLSLGALLFYVFVYTRWLKRTTPNNIVIGGAAGAVPPLVGYAAVTGQIDLMALYLFAIIFFWTPPHFWALALLMRREYERAQVPMLPIVRGEEETRRQIALYSIQLVALTIVMFAARLMGLVYLVAALSLGGLFLYFAWRLWRHPSTGAARQLFTYSMLYLTLLFAAMVVDRQVML